MKDKAVQYLFKPPILRDETNRRQGSDQGITHYWSGHDCD